MKLDYNCARNIMLTLEALNSSQYLNDVNCTSFPTLQGYTAEQIGYTIMRLVEAGYIPNTGITPTPYAGVHYEINSLTWEGHQYLDCIRNKAPWEKSLSDASVFESVPFKVLCELALQAIRHGVGLPG